MEELNGSDKELVSDGAVRVFNWGMWLSLGALVLALIVVGVLKL